MTLTAAELSSGGFVKDLDGRLVTIQAAASTPGAAGVPTGATPITASSGNAANASAFAALPGTAGKTTYITGFQLTAAGATAALVVNASVTGLVSGAQTFTFTFPVGATVAAQPLIVEFPEPIPASGVNTGITVTLPAGGAGNTNATANAQGFQL